MSDLDGTTAELLPPLEKHIAALTEELRALAGKVTSLPFKGYLSADVEYGSAATLYAGFGAITSDSLAEEDGALLEHLISQLSAAERFRFVLVGPSEDSTS